MATDIAAHIMNLVNQQQAELAATLQSRSMRKLELKVRATVYDDDDDDDQGPPQGESTEVSTEVLLYQTTGGEATAWTLKYKDAELRVPFPTTSSIQASEFVVQCAAEELKLAIQAWLQEHDNAGILADFDVCLHLTLTLGGGNNNNNNNNNEPWCMFSETHNFEDTQLSTWVTPVTTYLNSKAKMLLDVAQHVIVAAAAS